jgi:hypothetical protein
MRKPTHQAEFFRLFAHVLCYLYSGNNDAGYISKNEWNPHWRAQTGLHVPPHFLFSANNQKRSMYECIQVHTYEEKYSILNEEGDLDNESEDSDFEREMARKRDSTLSNLSTIVRLGSPMSLD